MSGQEFVLFEVDRDTGEMHMNLDGIVAPSQCEAAHQTISESLAKVGIGEATGGHETEDGQDKSSGVRIRDSYLGIRR